MQICRGPHRLNPFPPNQLRPLVAQASREGPGPVLYGIFRAVTAATTSTVVPPRRQRDLRAPPPVHSQPRFGGVFSCRLFSRKRDQCFLLPYQGTIVDNDAKYKRGPGSSGYYTILSSVYSTVHALARRGGRIRPP